MELCSTVHGKLSSVEEFKEDDDNDNDDNDNGVL